jgi:5-enolpyruvylshikimate-3-phosphate synthase
VRLGPRLSVEKKIQEASKSCAVPPLLLQPLVENAVRHGIAQLLDGGLVRIEPLEGELVPLELRVPGDISTAAFWMVAAALHPDAELHLPGVGVNPTRSGIIDVLCAMGADLKVTDEREQGGEPVADITVRSSCLAPVEVSGDLVPRLIDEIPVLAVAAALTPGRTVIRDAAELRVKESDRIATTCRELVRLGARVEELPDGLAIEPDARGRGVVAAVAIAGADGARIA